MENQELSRVEKKRFSLVARIKSANHAWRGIRILFASGHNVWVYVFFSFVVIYLGTILGVSTTEWTILVLTMGVVFVTETINTAIEIDMDLTSPSFHPYARDTKDVAAGAALLSVLMAMVIGVIIFLPKIYNIQG